VGKIIERSELGLDDKSSHLLALFYQNQLLAVYMPYPSRKEFYKPKKVFIDNN